VHRSPLHLRVSFSQFACLAANWEPGQCAIALKVGRRVSAGLAHPAPCLVAGSLWLPRSRESRYHFSQRTGPTYNSHITPDEGYVYSRALLEQACAPRCRPARLLVTRRGLDRASAAAPQQTAMLVN